MRADIAVEAADIAITSDDPLMIPAVVRLSQKTMRIVKQNFATAIAVNTAALVLASLGRVPVVWGAAVHNATTVLVVLNSLRLLLHRMKRSRRTVIGARPSPSRLFANSRDHHSSDSDRSA